jgi:hypothetical protein
MVHLNILLLQFHIILILTFIVEYLIRNIVINGKLLYLLIYKIHIQYLLESFKIL